jgi:hypothetical protein
MQLISGGRIMMRCIRWLSVMLLIMAIGCGKAEQATITDDTPHSLNITIDPRFELFSVVAFLSDYGQRTPLITRFDFPYKREVTAYFAPYKDHPAVKLFRELSSSPYSFRYDTPPVAILCLSDPPDLRIQSEIPKLTLSLSGGKEKLEQFFEELRSFARTTNFTAFFEAHRDLYAKSIENAQKQADGVDLIASLEKYFGMKQHSYNIIIVPLQSGSFGPKTGTNDIYNICGPDSIAGDVPVISGVRNICWHEFGHSFVNPIAEQYLPELRDYSALFDPIAGSMHCGGYDNLEGYVYEHVLRAVNIRLIAIHLGEEKAKEALQGNRSMGFVYVETLAEKLKQYETQRDKYRTFEDFFPQLVAVFDQLSKENLSDSFYAFPFTGTIRSVVSDYKDVFIVPSRENDNETQSKILRYVEYMRDKYHKGSLILTDEEALKQDLSSHSLMVFGTMNGNLWLDKYKDSLPFHIDADKITVDETPYPGGHFKLITAWPNPQDSSRGMVIYTAQEAGDILGSYDVPIWRADYVIARDNNALKSGSYVHNRQ